MSQQSFIVVKITTELGRTRDLNVIGVFRDRQKAEEVAALSSGLLIDVMSFERVPVVKKATFNVGGEKSASTLVMDEIEVEEN